MFARAMSNERSCDPNTVSVYRHGHRLNGSSLTQVAQAQRVTTPLAGRSATRPYVDLEVVKWVDRTSSQALHSRRYRPDRQFTISDGSASSIKKASPQGRHRSATLSEGGVRTRATNREIRDAERSCGSMETCRPRCAVLRMPTMMSASNGPHIS